MERNEKDRVTNSETGIEITEHDEQNRNKKQQRKLIKDANELKRMEHNERKTASRRGKSPMG